MAQQSAHISKWRNLLSAELLMKDQLIMLLDKVHDLVVITDSEFSMDAEA